MVYCVRVMAVLLLVCMMTSHTDGATKQDLYSLYDFLFTTSGYKKYVRPKPIRNDSTSVFVYMSFSLLSLVEVRDKDQTLVTNARLSLSWTDNLLSWDPIRYGNITSFLVRQEDIWLPDVIVANSVLAQEPLGYDELSVRIQPKGEIKWHLSTLIHSSCLIDITYYPFDTQKCFIEFETATSISSEVDINIDLNKPMRTLYYYEDGQWELIGTAAENLIDLDTKTRITFILLLKRRRTFYVVNIILPVMFLSLTASLVFALPADAGEKMGMGITVLLAYAVYLTIVSSFLPSTSVQTSILALYLTFLLGITALAVVVSVFILRIHHKPDSDQVGLRLKALTLLLRKITCSSRNNGYLNKNSVGPEGKSSCCEDVENLDNTRTSDTATDRETLTWQEVAKTFDWCLFWTFTIITSLVTALAFCVMVIGADINAPVIEDTRY